MPLLSLSTLFLLLLFLTPPSVSQPTSQLGILMALKASLDPQGVYLSSWSPSSSDSAGPCGGVFEGVACDEQGRVVNISLQGKGLAGKIPPEIGQLTSLSGLYLHFNQLHGVVPKEIASLSELSDLYLNVNNLSGEVPPEIEKMSNLQVLQLCYNKLSGSIPTQLGSLKKLSVLALQYNQLAGAIPASLGDLTMLKRLDLSFNRLFGSIPIKLANPPMLKLLDIRNNTLSGNVPADEGGLQQEKCLTPHLSLEYSNGWDPMAKGWSGSGFSQEVFESFVFNLEDVESATQHFSEVNLMGKSSFSAMYKGLMRDGSVVAIKCIAKSSCKSDEAQGECFLIYDFVPNGNLLQYLDVKASSGKVLEWSTRISIIQGIAKGIGYLHGKKGSKLALVHQNISAEKVLIGQRYNPLLSDAGLHKLLADDIIFSTLKSSAAMGYLAQEYTNTGRFTEKSDAYAFGMIIFQVLSGKRKITQLTRQGAETCKFEDFIDANLDGNFSESEAAKLGKIALLCTHESPDQRPAMVTVIQELSELCV
ncbi:leucine-rich repeat protein kinase family protein [Actinidia rufa]|uniref:Leucine-rich repeat protein kinase family protein n=1 Tax=Actinidia rufa TaxID=165716 RepID=A0A7J0F699_9ERIC|nr:leucine-rich repeat protein kinase family protein [Actinidia rufa]